MENVWKALLDISKTNLIIMDAVLQLQHRLAPDTVRRIPQGSDDMPGTNHTRTSEKKRSSRLLPLTQQIV